MRKLFPILLSIVFFGSCSSVKIDRTEVFIGQEPGLASFSWTLDSSEKDVVQKAYQIEVYDRNGAEVWNSGRVESAESIHVPYAGDALEQGEKYSWALTVWTGDDAVCKCRNAGSWFNGRNPDSWKASWIGLDGSGSIISDEDSDYDLAARYLRRRFDVGSGLKAATLYVCGLGSSYCYINGKPVSDDVWGPLPTWYDESVNYLTYDVTDMLSSGANAIGVMLGNGRYFGLRRNDYVSMRKFGFPSLLAELRLEYADGTVDTVLSDTAWSATDRGPVIRNNEFDGEHYDASLELGNWTEADYEEGEQWRSAELMAAPRGELRAQFSPCLKYQDTVVPTEVRQTPDGRVIIDMGQNMVGVLNARLKGSKGSPVTFRFAEILQPDNKDSLYVKNLRLAVVKDVYTPAADGTFEWEPVFVYHGFRYVEITGLDYLPAAEDFKGRVLYDAMRTTGTFECSNEILNAIHRNAFWGIRGNYRGMPTDCPQRDERMGWLGDRATGCYGESLIFDNETLYSKWMLDIEESMSEEGCISDVCPRYWTLFNANVTWPYAFITGVDMLYNRFGNTQTLIERYPAMRKWINFMMEKKFADGLLAGADTYGDWCLPPESPELIHSGDPTRRTDGDLLANAVFYDILRKMTGLCRIAGHPEDASFYESTADVIKEAYNAKYFNESEGYYANNTVTANILSLRYGLAPEGQREQLMRSISNDITLRWDSHVSVGVLGVQHLMRGLSENGALDLAYTIATNDTYPSLGYMYRKGATTIWELWNGDTADPAMNSGNHVMLLGDTVIWLYEYLAGIRNAEGSVGYKHILLEPCLPEGLDWVNCSYDSASGEIVSNWSRNAGEFRWDVVIPAGSTAELRFPDGTSASIGSGSYSYKINLSK